MSISASVSHAFSASNPDWQHEEHETNSEEDAEEIEEEEEDEVDQLVDESISEPEEPTEEDSSVKEPGRLPGQTLLPAVRLENIMQADGVTGSLSLSREGMFVLSVATSSKQEEFIKRLTQGGHREAIAEGRSSIHYADMAILPPPMSLADALELREARLKDIRDEDPSLSTLSITATPGQHSPNFDRLYTSLSNSKPKKNRSTNGKEKVNGAVSSANASGMSSVHESATPALPASNSGSGPQGWRSGPMLDARPWSHWADTAEGSSSNSHDDSHHPALGVNGSQSFALANGAPSIARPGTATGTATPSVPPTSSSSPSVTRDSRPESVSPVNSTTSDQQGQFTGPGSSYLQGPGGPSPFSRTGADQGRTIYSQQS
ncbi:hypothetical protein D9758_002688 [Tetrapyrgos nigripes]|uniref:Uncharacterized protein n=1 Tax=Tetrapyrgos nigripes TaxID=182062 RepID=A0A8H5GRG7_9AGAR|nr:hypothetical protein D9758_002688 [Tetrapyrgos nigripes]